MPITWKAPQEVQDLVTSIKSQHHLPRLEQAKISVVFVDSKPFIKDRFNWGKVVKFSNFSQMWMDTKWDFCIQVCSNSWHLLTASQKSALLDLHLTRCEAQYEPEVVVENGKKKVVKDEMGRVQYTQEIRTDDEGNIRWQVLPLDLLVFSKNVTRYGLWCQELNNLKEAMSDV